MRALHKSLRAGLGYAGGFIARGLRASRALRKGSAGGGAATTPAKTLTGADGTNGFYGFFMGGIENAHP